MITVTTQVVLDKIKSCTTRSVALEPEDLSDDKFFESEMEMVTEDKV